jgi:tetratricopeptide (TPR) repeat protein
MWLVKRARGGRAWLNQSVLFRPWRRRRLRRWLLAGSRAAEKRVAAIAEMSQFLADPCAFRGAEPTTPDCGLDWLTQPHVPWVLRAQGNALNGDFRGAEGAIRRALAMLGPRDAVEDGWRAAALGPATSLRDVQGRRELAALAQAFLAGTLLAQGKKNYAKKEIERACSSQPNIAYLHEVRAEVLMADNDHAEAFGALDRAAVLRGTAKDAGTRLSAVIDLVIAAIRIKRAADAADKRSLAERQLKSSLAERLLNRAAARLDALLRDKLDDADPDQLAAARFLRGRLALEQSTIREATDKAPAADRHLAIICFEHVAIMKNVPEHWRERAEGWLAVAKGPPWRAVHDALARSRDESDPLTDELAAALIVSAGRPEIPQRLVLRVSAEMLPDDEAARLITRAADADQNTIDLPAFHRTVRETIGIEPPSVLISRIVDGESGRVDVLLDAVPIGTESFLDEKIECDWFGVTRLLPRAQAAVALLAESVMRHLDRVLDAGHAQRLGVDDFPYTAWSPTLRLLLADRTPLHDRAALRRAVANVAWGKASPAEAAHGYRNSVGLPLWGAGLPEAAAPDDVLRPLAVLALCNVGRPYRPNEDAARAAVLAHDEADRIVKWATDQAQGSTSGVSFTVSDTTVQPWLRALLRDRLPDHPVLEPEPSSTARSPAAF